MPPSRARRCLRSAGLTVIAATLACPSVLASAPRSVRGDLDHDRQRERVFATSSGGGSRLLALRVSDRCRGGRISRRISGRHEALAVLRLLRADTRRGREVLYDLRNGAAGRVGEARLVGWRRTGKEPMCRAPRYLLRYSTRRPTSLPRDAHGLSDFSLRVRELSRRFRGREAVLTERFSRLGDGDCCPSITKRTYYRYSRRRDRYVRYRTAMAGTPPQAGQPKPAEGGPVIAAAGDIACDPADTTNPCRQQSTSDLLLGAGLSGVLTLGDNQYEDAQLTKFLQRYAPSWGRVKGMTHPAIGNHEYLDPAGGAKGYFDYFGAAAGERGKGYYSFDLGGWHLVALNSNCAEVGGCGAGSAQEQWLRQDLAAHPRACVLAYWHHPRFSSGPHGDTVEMGPIWQALYDHRADVVLAGHDHSYERFAPQDATGRLDPARGIREFVVGTGGKVLYPFLFIKPNSEVRDNTTFGVLKLALRPSSYEWRFEPVAGQTFTDAGSAACH